MGKVYLDEFIDPAEKYPVIATTSAWQQVLILKL